MGMALLDERPKASRPVAARSPEARARLRPVSERVPHAPAAWLFDVAAFDLEFGSLWESLGDAPVASSRGIEAVHPGTDRVLGGDTTALRSRAAAIWNSTGSPVADVVARLEVSAPEDWDTVVDERHLGHWFRLVMAAHLTPVGAPSSVDELRVGLPSLGFTHVEARRAARGRELGDLAVELSPDGYGPAVSLSLGHGHKGWLGPADASALRQRLASVPPASFRSAQHLVGPCESLWNLLGLTVDLEHQVLVLWSP
jgi:hypothetical protein